MKRQLIIGMPSSGKSTFIAALRHLLLANEVPTVLELTGLSDEEAHVNALEAKWVACKEIERTKPATEGWVEFQVRNRETMTETVLSIPDLRGETFEQPLCSGRCSSELSAAVAEADALLVFTNADRPADMGLISDLNDMIEDNPQTPAKGPPSARRAPMPFKPENMPEEAKIVEFLQMANRRPMLSRQRKIGLVISAWDVVSGSLSPEDWFADHRPMLEQFLSNNSDLWDRRIYGVSALGGRFPRDRQRLKRKIPSKRIIVVGPETIPHDLTSLLSWLGAA